MIKKTQASQLEGKNINSNKICVVASKAKKLSWHSACSTEDGLLAEIYRLNT